MFTGREEAPNHTEIMIYLRVALHTVTANFPGSLRTIFTSQHVGNYATNSGKTHSLFTSDKI